MFKRGITQPLSGYNHPAMLNAFKDPAKMATLVNRPALGVYPGSEWPNLLKNVLMSVVPKGLENGHVSRNLLDIFPFENCLQF